MGGEVVLSLRGIDGVTDVDADAGQLTAGAGATIAAVQAAAAARRVGVRRRLGPRDTATVGGSVATNAGGIRMLRFGDTRAQVARRRGRARRRHVVSHLGGLVKDNTGYHLPSLLCGSEGTLGVVTAARLRLVPRYAQRVVAARRRGLDRPTRWSSAAASVAASPDVDADRVPDRRLPPAGRPAAAGRRVAHPA